MFTLLGFAGDNRVALSDTKGTDGDIIIYNGTSLGESTCIRDSSERQLALDILDGGSWVDVNGDGLITHLHIDLYRRNGENR